MNNFYKIVVLMSMSVSCFSAVIKSCDKECMKSLLILCDGDTNACLKKISDCKTDCSTAKQVGSTFSSKEKDAQKAALLAKYYEMAGLQAEINKFSPEFNALIETTLADLGDSAVYLLTREQVDKYFKIIKNIWDLFQKIKLFGEKEYEYAPDATNLQSAESSFSRLTAVADTNLTNKIGIRELQSIIFAIQAVYKPAVKSFSNAYYDARDRAPA